MKYTKFTKIEKYKNINWKDFNYIIYAHSFLDAQLWLGYDGFKNLFDWLEFTIDKLVQQNNKVIIKSHPNFYNSSIGKMAKLDQMLFVKILKKYTNNKNVLFINDPIKNFELLNKVSKKTTLISHHGSALLEGMYLGYKCISSVATFWSNDLKLTNQWKNEKEYIKLLKMNWSSLSYCNRNDLNFILFNVYWKDTSIYGGKHFLEIISKKSKISRKKMFKIQHKLSTTTSIKNKITEMINRNIEEINNI